MPPTPAAVAAASVADAAADARRDAARRQARLTACRAKRFIEMGLFASEESVADYVARLEASARQSVTAVCPHLRTIPNHPEPSRTIPNQPEPLYHSARAALLYAIAPAVATGSSRGLHGGVEVWR